MDAKEKARDLYNKFYDSVVHRNSIQVRHDYAKKSALICIEEVIKSSDHAGGGDDYWNEVKTEIQSL